MEQLPQSEQVPEEGSRRFERERVASGKICEQISVVFDKAEKRASEEADFVSPDKTSDKRFPVESAVDHMVAVSQREQEEMEGVLESVRESGDYYQEKIALKMEDFLKKEEALLRSLAELKTRFPEVADLLQIKKPHLQRRIEDAEQSMNN